MKIRKMTPNDIPTVVAIEETHYATVVSESELLKEINTKNNGRSNPCLAPVVTVDDDGNVIGYLMFDRSGVLSEKLTILVISTAKGHERKGVASGMIEHVRSKMKELQVRHIVSRVHQDRIPAQSLFAKFGFSCDVQQVQADGKEHEVYEFTYTVPLDDLSARHIAKIARESKEARLSNQQEEE